VTVNENVKIVFHEFFRKMDRFTPNQDRNYPLSILTSSNTVH